MRPDCQPTKENVAHQEAEDAMFSALWDSVQLFVFMNIPHETTIADAKAVAGKVYECLMKEHRRYA